MWNARQPLVRWATRGALVALALSALSFIFWGGAHGPIGPMVVLAANYPVFYLVHLFFEAAPTSELLQLLLMIVIVTVNGAVRNDCGLRDARGRWSSDAAMKK